MLPSMIAEEVDRGLVRAIDLDELAFPLPAVISYPSARPIPPAGELLLRELLSEIESGGAERRTGAGQAAFDARRSSPPAA
jgi:hypothetical protein